MAELKFRLYVSVRVCLDCVRARADVDVGGVMCPDDARLCPTTWSFASQRHTSQHGARTHLCCFGI